MRFGGPATAVARAPGRVNLIGEHTDYNEGFVLPMAIDRAVWIAFRARNDLRVKVHSIDFNETIEFSLDGLAKGGPEWGEYIKGVAWALTLDGTPIHGWEGVMSGDVPRGAGLSSSAALELAAARVFAEVSALSWDPMKTALLCQKAENRWVGVNCGIMDQLVSSAAAAGHALLIDCRSLELQHVPLPRGTVVVVMDTKTRRGLVDSEYNERRGSCERAARTMGVRSLRQIDEARLKHSEETLDDAARRRARHVISENARTLEAVDAMRHGNAGLLGRLMNTSHASLRDGFEVSTRELNTMVEIACAQPSCHGARMTGAGFGGCAIALVQETEVDRFCRDVAKGYEVSTGIAPDLYPCSPSGGTELIPLKKA